MYTNMLPTISKTKVINTLYMLKPTQKLPHLRLNANKQGVLLYKLRLKQCLP